MERRLASGYASEYASSMPLVCLSYASGMPSHVGESPSRLQEYLFLSSRFRLQAPRSLPPNQMVQEAGANYEVTLPMVHRRSRLKCSQRTVARVLHKRGYRFFRLYDKMILTLQDIGDSYS